MDSEDRADRKNETEGIIPPEDETEDAGMMDAPGPESGAGAEPEEDEGAPVAASRFDARFAGMSDERVVELCHQGNAEAMEYLLDKYKNFVRSKARSYFLIGADHEDIVQEGMIGLYKAIRDYRSEKLSSFRAFAELCVTRQKHIPLNSYVSLNKPIFDDETDRTLMDIISEEMASNPEELLISREDISLIEGRIGGMLSPLEKQVLLRYLDGKSYQDISDELGRHVKSIDNALQRIKRKLLKYLEEK